MKNAVIALSLAVAGLACASADTAEAGTPVVNGRQHLQSHAIYRGVATGRLTYGETKRLARGQARVRAMERIAKSDGVVTGWERVRLNTALTLERARIYRLKHN